MEYSNYPAFLKVCKFLDVNAFYKLDLAMATFSIFK